MVPTDDSFPTLLAALVRAGAVPEARLDTSVRRILELKDWLGLLPPLANAASAAAATPRNAATQRLIQSVGHDRALSLDAARGSVTLLLNNGASRTAQCAQYDAAQCSWTLDWSCPNQPAGQQGNASVDGTIGYHCCCVDPPFCAATQPVSSCTLAPSILPLNASSSTRMLVVGPAAKSLRILNGGWYASEDSNHTSNLTLPPNASLSEQLLSWQQDDALARRWRR